MKVRKELERKQPQIEAVREMPERIYDRLFKPKHKKIHKKIEREQVERMCKVDF